jgi:uncharacterized protein (UPF0297 family)
MENGYAPSAESNLNETYTEETISEEEALRLLFAALPEVNMDPFVQISGFLTSDDPSYLPDHKNVRTVLTKVGRDKLLRYLLRVYREQDTTQLEDQTV